MVRGRTETGDMEVRVVLQVRIDRDAYVEQVMIGDPAEVLDRDVRKDVKKAVRETLLNNSETLCISSVIAEGIYEL